MFRNKIVVIADLCVHMCAAVASLMPTGVIALTGVLLSVYREVWSELIFSEVSVTSLLTLNLFSTIVTY